MGRESNGCSCDGDYMFRDVFGCDALYFGLENNYMNSFILFAGRAMIFNPSHGYSDEGGNPIINTFIFIGALILLIFLGKRWFGR